MPLWAAKLRHGEFLNELKRCGPLCYSDLSPAQRGKGCARASPANFASLAPLSRSERGVGLITRGLTSSGLGL